MPTILMALSSSRVSVWVFVFETDTPGGHPGRPLAPEIWLCCWTSRKGVPAPPLRSEPGTPFLDQHIYRCVGEDQQQSIGAWASGRPG
jgi:hypothetical protein